MSMTHSGVDQYLTADEAFDITLLVNAEMTYQVLAKRNANTEGRIGKRRRNLLKSLNNIVEAINQTYKGQVPESFIKRAETYYITTELAMNTLLKGYKNK
jgi:hypothetical protein